MKSNIKKFSRRKSGKRSSHRVRDFFISAGVVGFLCTIFVFLFLIRDMPDLDNLESKGRRASVIFEAYNGKNIANYGDLFKEAVRVEQLPKYVGNAVVAIEDHRFYKHGGVDFFGIIRALFTNTVKGRVVQGGSTLTQQIAKNLFLSPSRSIKRKVQEAVLAIWLERKFTKKQLLSIYLNRVYFGSGAYGIDAAAFRFFGKRAKNLSLLEAARLAGVLKSPRKYSPLFNKEESDKRAALVLSCMKDEKYISAEEEMEALQDIDKISDVSSVNDENRYFTDWIMEHLEELVKIDDEDLIVRTTLDLNLQKKAVHVVRKMLNDHGFANGANQMALVAMDKAGAIRAMVGGHTYAESQFNRVLASRSFGSAFKYFVYISALEHGFDIYDVISDLPIKIGNWSPKNYKYNSVGEISLLQAFTKSVNTCTVRLAHKIGIPTVAYKAHELGITTELHNNLSTALGACDANLLDMTAAYGATMIDGEKFIPFGVVSIKNKKGRILYRYRPKHQRVISSEICSKMKILLKSVVDSGTGKRARIPNLSCYGKTGTSNDSRDASFIGFADSLVTGIWIGNDDNGPMHKNMTGGMIPAMAWQLFMMEALGLQKIDEATSVQDDKEFKRTFNRKKKRLKSLVKDLMKKR